MLKKITFLFPKTDHFQEERPRINYEDMYGWIDAYCMLFDPRNILLLQGVPNPANGTEKISSDDFIITSDKVATSELAEKFPLQDLTGIFVRPESCGKVFDGYKERIETPVARLYNPIGLKYDAAENGEPVPGWKIGDFSALHKELNHLSVRFEIFSFFWRISDEMPEERYKIGTRFLNELLRTAGFDVQKCRDDEASIFEFMSYGLNRFLIWHLAERKNVAVEFPDSLIMLAAAAWNKGTSPDEYLRKAFSILADIRRNLSNTEFLFYEAPHFGVYLDGQPFIEVEWPQNLIDRMRNFLKDAHENQWRPSFEGSMNCWSHLLEKSPDLQQELVQAWNAGEIDLVNGTYALPFSLFSPLAMQYREFQQGSERFQQLFGKKPKTYECQENAFSPQMPDLLKMFGYEHVIHVTQNHGTTPVAERNFNWSSPSGTKIPAIGCENARNAKAGMHIFFNLPDRAAEFEGEQLLFNMMDIATIPMRELMVRSMKYSQIWGRFVTVDDLKQPATVCHSYNHDDYQLSQSYFYIKPNRDNMLSAYEKIFAFNDYYRNAQLLDPDFYDAEFEQNLCMLESHDVLVAAGERPGEFYRNFAIEAPPFIPRVVIDDKVQKIVSNCEQTLKSVFSENAPLWNLSGSQLPFIRLNGDYVPVKAEPWRQINLLETCAEWESIDCSTDDFLSLSNGLQCRNFDSRGYKWKAISHTLKKRDYLFKEQIILYHEGESVELSMVYTNACDFFEISVQYAVNGFECKRRKSLDEYLSLRFTFTDSAQLNKVRVFSPNIESETALEKVCSPYYLRLPEQNCLFLNQGAFFYEINRDEAEVDWIYHVPLEKVHTRSMAVSFRKETPLEQARGWAHGVVSGNPKEPAQWKDLEQLSIECRTRNGKWLVSNLSEESILGIPPSGISEI